MVTLQCLFSLDLNNKQQSTFRDKHNNIRSCTFRWNTWAMLVHVALIYCLYIGHLALTHCYARLSSDGINLMLSAASSSYWPAETQLLNFNAWVFGFYCLLYSSLSLLKCILTLWIHLQIMTSLESVVFQVDHRFGCFCLHLLCQSTAPPAWHHYHHHHHHHTCASKSQCKKLFERSCVLSRDLLRMVDTW